MKHIDIGGWKVSKLTLGTVQLGMNYGVSNKTGKPSIEEAFCILDTALQGGINSFDTASAYGDSEEVLGKYFCSSRCKIKKPFLTTKFKLKLPLETDGKTIEKEIRLFAESSLEKLNINRIPVYMLHSAIDMSQYGDIVPKTMNKLKNEGLIEKAGVSVYHSSEAEKMLDFDTYEAIQLPMNIFDMRMGKSGVLKKLNDSGIIVFVRSVFLQGLFFLDLGQMPQNLQFVAKYLNQIQQIAYNEGLSVAQLALVYIRDLKGVSSLVLGAETPEQVRENISLMESPGLNDNTNESIVKLSEQIPIEAIMKSLITRSK